MKVLLTTLFAVPFYFSSFSQVSFTGNATPTNAVVGGASVVVDNSLVLTTAGTINGANVAVSANLSPTDVLSFNSSALPAGVSGSYNSNSGILSFSGTATAAAYETLLRTVSFSASVAGAGNRTVTFNLGSPFTYHANGHFYEYVSGAYTWTDAKTNASGRNLFGLTGYMATITSAGENEFIRQKVGGDGWVGGTDDVAEINASTGAATYANQLGAEGNFYWVTGPEAGTRFSAGNHNPVAAGGSFMNWNAAEPNNWANMENYVQILITGSFPGKWNDLPNNATLGYIVEYGGMAGDPAVDPVHSRTITLTTVSTDLTTTAAANSYVINAPAVIVDNAITVNSGGNITDARVTISGNFQSGDQLSYSHGSLPAGITGSYNAATGVLSFTGTAAPGGWETLFRTVSFSSSGIPANRTVTFSVGNLIAAGNGHFYEFIAAGQSWSGAKTAAASRAYLGITGYLATITSQTENDFIQQKLSANGWIGSSDDVNEINAATGVVTYSNQSAAEANWYWVTGPEAGTRFSAGNAPSMTVVAGQFANWNSIEPNNSNGNEHHGMIYSSGSGATGLWNDAGPGTQGYVVEYGGLPADPANNLSANRTINIHIALPVRELVFSAIKNENAVWLNWSTGYEPNLARFEVLHSADNRNFKKIATVASVNNSNSRSTYSYEHKSPISGSNYYRIKAVDRDGTATLSDTRLVNLKASYGLYPTVVTNGQFTITQPLSTAINLTIRNAVGATVLQRTINNTQATVNAANLPPGTYFAQFGKDGQLIACIRFMKK